ncbi:hypothetical protein [Sulfobacillus thermosulfidooxidans]|uniref:hypothetical protein n=1 Tax=Sulfobacillus thermosulfidooxidans TaxID=28034 RepID=UPI0006B53D06|nr:hypothetical protein [Sulfobacillus thermosulfidooxidans]
MDPSYESIYQKLWIAHMLHEASWDGTKYRVYLGDCVLAVLSPEDREHPAWFQYNTLQGRSPLFVDFLRTQLGITDDNAITLLQTWWDRWATERVQRFLASRIENHKIVAWPLPLPAGGPS